VATACKELVHVAMTVEPQEVYTALYQERYEKFRKIYPACKQLFKELAA
jgi:xylulokinase